MAKNTNKFILVQDQEYGTLDHNFSDSLGKFVKKFNKLKTPVEMTFDNDGHRTWQRKADGKTFKMSDETYDNFEAENDYDQWEAEDDDWDEEYEQRGPVTLWEFFENNRTRPGRDVFDLSRIDILEFLNVFFYVYYNNEVGFATKEAILNRLPEYDHFIRFEGDTVTVEPIYAATVDFRLIQEYLVERNMFPYKIHFKHVSTIEFINCDYFRDENFDIKMSQFRHIMEFDTVDDSTVIYHNAEIVWDY